MTTRSGESPKPERACILVVDDDPKIRTVLKHVIEVAGLRVIVAENGEDAVKLLESGEHNVDLLVLDMIMPVLSGPEALEKIKTKGLKPRVILCSGSHETASAASSQFPDLVRGSIAKPFAVEQIVTAVRQALAE